MNEKEKIVVRIQAGHTYLYLPDELDKDELNETISLIEDIIIILNNKLMRINDKSGPAGQAPDRPQAQNGTQNGKD